MGDKYSLVHVEKSLESTGTVNNMQTPNAQYRSRSLSLGPITTENPSQGPSQCGLTEESCEGELEFRKRQKTEGRLSRSQAFCAIAEIAVGHFR